MERSRIWRALFSYGTSALLALQIVASALPAYAAAAVNDFVITEINWAGSTGRSSDEWIEIYNNSSNPLTLSPAAPYTLSYKDENGTSQTITLDHILDHTGNPSILLPLEHLVVHPSVVGTTLNLSAIGLKHTIVPSLSLPNVATEYILKDDAANEIDAVKAAAVGAPIPFAGSAGTTTAPIASMERTDLSASAGTDPAKWQSASVVGVDFLDSAVQYGTPADERTTDPTLGVPQFDEASATISGTATSNSTVTLSIHRFVPNQPASTTTMTYPVGFTGTYSFPLSLTPGRYTFDVVAEDLHGDRTAPQSVLIGPGTNYTYVVLATTPTAVPQPVVSSIPTVTNQSSVSLQGTVATGAVAVDILLNGEFYTNVPVASNSFSADVFLAPNQSNELTFIGVASDGTVSQPVVHTVRHDNVAAQITATITPAQPGMQDMLSGSSNEAGTFTVYADQARTQLVGGPITFITTDTFSFSVGDNRYANLYVRFEDLAGNLTDLVVANPIEFTIPGGGLGQQVSSAGENQVTIGWTPVTGAVNYLIKYRKADGTYSAPMLLCANGTVSCQARVTLINLTPDTAYAIAIAAVDQYGNASSYSEFSFRTSAPTPSIASTTPSLTTAVSTTESTQRTTTPSRRVQPSPTPTPTPEPTATPEPSPTPEEGEVMSTEEDGETNWTPWIFVGALLAIAAIGTLGYFYWFGGAAGEAALNSAMEERKRTKASTDEPSAPSEPPADDSSPRKKNGGSKDKRW